MSTINNDIPFVPENTTDPAAGLNLSLNVIDALLQIAVVAIQDTPPGAPTEGQRYIVGTAGTGDWSGQDNRLARYLDGAWSFYDARMAVNLADGNLYARNSTGWGVVTGGGGGSGIVETVVAGTGISVDSTDPANPVVSATGGGGSGNVPAGGTTGQVLAKASNSNYDTEWVAAGGGSDRRTVTALTSSSGVVTIDYALGDYFTWELDEDVTGWIIANPPTGGASIGVEITQDSTARTVAFGAEYEFTASSPLDAVPSGAGEKALLIMTSFDGGNNWWLTMDTTA